MSILDFLYFGEAKDFEGDFDSFLAIAEEIQLKGLTGQTPEEHQKPQLFEPMPRGDDYMMTPTTLQADKISKENFSSAVEIPNQSITNPQALDAKVKSMMEKGLKMIPDGTSNGKPRQTMSTIYKMCGKEVLSHHIRDHIEANHLEGVSIPCELCNDTFASRNALTKHTKKCHK